MNTNQRTSRILGLAFLLQFISSFISGAVVQPVWTAAGSFSDTMLKIAQSPALMQFYMLLNVLTALGIIFLGAMLYLTLRKWGDKAALVALGFYLLEAALLAVSQAQAFSLLRLSQEYAAAGQPEALLSLGKLAFETMTFTGSTLHMLVFCFGAILFYSLLDRSRIVPRWMSLWGLITVFPMLLATLTQVFGVTLPFYLYVPYLPFELVIAIWLLVWGVPEGSY